jgi:hypothetical protein
MAFDGQLNTNEVFSTVYNQIISIQVFPTGVDGLTGIYSPKKVDGTLYGDTKIYRSTDVLQSYGWTHSDSTYNLLTQKRPPNPKVDKIELDIFRQIPVSVDEYLTKRAYMDEGTFAEMNGVILSWMQKTKEVYEHTTYTANMLVSAQAKATALTTIDLKATTLGGTPTGRDLLLWRAQELYRQIEDQLKELEEPSRSYNDLEFLRTYKLSDFDIIVPLGVLSSVRKHDVPFLFTPDNKPIFKEVHWKYFGAIIASGGTTAASNTNVRALVEKVYGGTNYFPGDLLPNSTAYLANEVYTATYTAKPSIASDVTILMIHKQDYPIMSAFSVGTSFFNAKTLVTNHYLTYGHNDVYDAHLRERALLKVATDVA